MLKEESRLHSKECRQEICPSPSLIIIALYTAHFLFFFSLKVVLDSNEGLCVIILLFILLFISPLKTGTVPDT